MLPSMSSLSLPNEKCRWCRCRWRFLLINCRPSNYCSSRYVLKLANDLERYWHQGITTSGVDMNQHVPYQLQHKQKNRKGSVKYVAIFQGSIKCSMNRKGAKVQSKKSRFVIVERFCSSRICSCWSCVLPLSDSSDNTLIALLGYNDFESKKHSWYLVYSWQPRFTEFSCIM